jgi:predicted transposase/invertase (TIGR01784 family)
MGRSNLTMDKILRDAGYIDKWMAEGEARGEARGKAEGKAEGEERKATEIARNMLQNGFSYRQTAKLSGLDVKKIKALAN